jgi:hypothetical protein
MAEKEVENGSCFSYGNLGELATACVEFYRKSLQEDLPEVIERRKQLAKWVRGFHQKCGTLTSDVEASIGNLEEGSCLILMTAHQPNLFAYSGVFRKASLNHVLGKRLSERLRVPIVCFFGVADQDFTDDRWVRSALLPDVERRDGLLELRFDLPEKLMLNKVAKPSKKVLDSWKNEIENWLNRKLSSIGRGCESFGLQFNIEKAHFEENFEGFWALVEDAYGRAETYADFNAFVMSKVVNEAWGYGTLFSRFSECQQIFEPEFRLLLSRFDEYSRYIKGVTFSGRNLEPGVCDQEFETVPFWYHCSCGSKARLRIEEKHGSFAGCGLCLLCGKEYRIDFGSRLEPRVSEVVSRISARSLSMPLVLFNGLKIGCYVGGVGGMDYLKQARYVAERLGLVFPPVAIWRPRDVYFGVGQMDALLLFRRLSGTFDFSQFSVFEAALKKKVADVEKAIDALELENKAVMADLGCKKEEKIQRLKEISGRQNEVRKAAGFSLLVHNLKLLGNVAEVMRLYPCIVDYAVNVGLKGTGAQWLSFLERNGGLSSDVRLETCFDDVLSCVQS